MADVRPYDPQVDVRPDSTPYAPEEGVSPVAFGDGVGRAVEQAGGVAGDLVKREKANADAAAVMGAIGQAKGALNDLILDPVKGYAAQRGDQALASRDQYLQKFDETLRQIGSGLHNPEQERAFEQHVAQIHEEGIRHALSHETVQIEDAAQARYKGAESQTLQTLRTTVADSASRAQQLGDLQRLATAEAVRRYGNSPDAVASVVGPAMQNAGIAAMESAIASQDPQVAKSTFESVGKYLGPHEHVYGNTVRAIEARARIDAEASDVIAKAAASVVVPGGAQVPRLDAARLSAELLKLPDGPLKADVVKAIEQRQVVLDKVWDQTVAQRVTAAERAGTSAASGQFSMTRVPVAEKIWLQQNAPGELIKLNALDARLSKQGQTQVRADSREAYTDLMSDMIDPDKRREVYGAMSAEKFNSVLNDYPLIDQDKQKALGAFKKIKDEVGKLAEPVPRIVDQALNDALRTDSAGRKKYAGPLMDEANAYVEDQKAKNSGRAPSPDEIRKFVDSKIARAPGSGWFGSDIAAKRQIELDISGGGAARPTVSTQPDAQDQAAIDWLKKNPTAPSADAVRRKLKGKGLVQ